MGNVTNWIVRMWFILISFWRPESGTGRQNVPELSQYLSLSGMRRRRGESNHKHDTKTESSADADRIRYIALSCSWHVEIKKHQNETHVAPPRELSWGQPVPLPWQRSSADTWTGRRRASRRHIWWRWWVRREPWPRLAPRLSEPPEETEPVWMQTQWSEYGFIFGTLGWGFNTGALIAPTFLWYFSFGRR